MPSLDYRDVRADEVSIGDLLDFDALMRTLTDDQRAIVNRKIAHEVAEGEPAQALSSREEMIDDLETERDEAEERARKAEQEADSLEGKNELLQRHIDAMTKDHARELVDAEQRGYERGRAERAA